MARQDCLFWQLYLLGQKKYNNMSSINTYFVKKISLIQLFCIYCYCCPNLIYIKKGGCLFSVYQNETDRCNIYMKGDDVSFGDVYIGAKSLSIPDVYET